MLRLAFILCVAAACGRQSSAPRPGSGSSTAPAAAEPAARPAAEPAKRPAAPAEPRAAPDEPRAVRAAPDEECKISECGPAMRMPNRRCPDGSMAGPTGRCLRKPDGRCGWEIRACP